MFTLLWMECMWNIIWLVQMLHCNNMDVNKLIDWLVINIWKFYASYYDAVTLTDDWLIDFTPLDPVQV
jgi:hypothetical protein